jgi:hypothetical protein
VVAAGLVVVGALVAAWVVGGAASVVGATVVTGALVAVAVAGLMVGWTVTVGKATVVVTGAEVVVTGVAAAVVVAAVEAAPVTVGVELTEVWDGVFVTFEGTSSLQAASKLSIVTRETIARISLKKLFFIIVSKLFFLFFSFNILYSYSNYFYTALLNSHDLKRLFYSNGPPARP